jgi:DNA-binding NarL/FixJ family response regulator
VGVVVNTRHYREAVLRALDGAAGLVAIDLGEGNAKSLEKFEGAHTEVLLADLSNQTLIAFIRQAHAAVPSTPIIALNRGETELELLSLFECGLTGFVAHDAGREEILDTIRAALRGEFTCPPRIAAALARRVNAAGESKDRPLATAALSPRELQIVRHLEKCMTNREIAARLGIDASTVKIHIHKILRKLATHGPNGDSRQMRPRLPELRFALLSLSRREHRESFGQLSKRFILTPRPHLCSRMYVCAWSTALGRWSLA